MDDTDFIEPFERLLEDVAPLVKLRAIEAGGSTAELWAGLQSSGFLDVLVPENAGGAGLPPSLVGRLMQSLGRRLIPVPVGETMIARALLASAGAEQVAGPTLLVTATSNGAEGYRSAAVPHASAAQYVLVDLGTKELVLTALSDAIVVPTGLHASQGRSLAWAAEPLPIATLPRPAGGVRSLAAIVRAAAIAGAVEAVARLTLDHAGTRNQFGKPIGKNQAIQQQLAIMAEQVVMARTAAQIGFAGGIPPSLRAAAIGKQIAGNAAGQVAAIAHAVHGAIGISEEYDLQLYTRRLNEWRLADGGEGYWAELLGNERLVNDMPSIDFLRMETSAIA